MRFVLIYFLFSTLICVNAQEVLSCDGLKEGVFESYEDGQKIGLFYRKGAYQIEKVINDSTYNLVKVKSNKCLYYIRKYKVNDKLDTITWTINYDKHLRNSFTFEAKPTYLNINFIMQGRVVKVRDSVKDEKILKIFNTLENN